MKTSITLFFGLLLLLISTTLSSEEVTTKSPSLDQGSVNIACTPDLYDLTSKWASEFKILNPGINIMVKKTGFDSKDWGTGENLSFISGKSTQIPENGVNWKMVLGRDVIVPVMNAGNPLLDEILQRGISTEMFAKMFNNPEQQNWGTLLAGGQDAPVHIYITNEESVKEKATAFLRNSQIPAEGITLGSRDEVVRAIQNDPYAIGFCSVASILGTDNQSLVEKIRLLPIDRNGNGSLDYLENIYGDLDLFLRGVWIGKYPKVLSGNIYAVSKEKPENKAELAFLTWILTDGQQFMNSNGYCELAGSESQSQIDKINMAEISLPAPVKADSMAKLALLFLAVALVLAIGFTYVFRYYSSKRKSIKGELSIRQAGFDENSILVPNGLYFDKTHTWAFMEKDGTVTIGLDDFMQHITGPVTRIEMKNHGEKIKKGELLCSIIQSGKQLNMYAPVSGTIKEQNEALTTNSSFINTSPYTKGWVYLIEPSDWLNEIPLLDMADRYKRWLNAEFLRVKDFLATTLKPDSPEYSHVVMQDGGVLKEGVLADFGPEIWEDFQSDFLDTYK